jgi:hypothetical protein
MINRRSVPALHRACLHQPYQPETKNPDVNFCANLLKTDMTAVPSNYQGSLTLYIASCLER